MTRKRVTVVLYGSDRNLWHGGRVDVRVSDVFASHGPRVLVAAEAEGSTVELHLDLPFDTGQMYGVVFGAPDHHPAWYAIRQFDFLRGSDRVEADDLMLRLMLVPHEPGLGDVPNGYARLRQAASPFVSGESGLDEATFAALDDAAKMACLNIEAKLRETTIDGASLLSFVRGVSHVAVDRVFLKFDAGLKARMQRARDFAGARGHATPPEGLGLPGHPDSWKHTRFGEGNMQVSFSRDAAPLDGATGAPLVHSVDVDIDLGRGPHHAAEYLDNKVFRPGHKTNQVLVYALLYAQGIAPQYVLEPVAATTRAAPVLRSRRLAPPRPKKPAGRRRVRRARPATRKSRGRSTKKSR